MIHAMMILFSFAMAIAGITVVLFLANRINRWAAIEQMIKKRFGKSVSEPWLLEMLLSNSPRYRFLYRGIGCYLKVDCGGGGILKTFAKIKPPSAELFVDWPRREKGWRISTKHHETNRWFALPCVVHGSNEFRERFYVYGRDAESVTQAITPSVQQGLMQLTSQDLVTADSLSRKYFDLSLSRGRLKFEIAIGNSDPIFIERYVRCCLHIYDQMVIGEVEGVTFVEDELTIIDSLLCPICSGEIAEDLVLCSSCKSPHCRDCWEYNGKCATFACSETTYVIGGRASNRNPSVASAS